MAAAASQSKHRSDRLIVRLIAVFKFVKAALLIAIGVGALRLVHQDIRHVVHVVVRSLHLDENGRYVHHAIASVTGLTPHRLRQIGFGFFFYSALFLVEGTGLWLDKRWAEYLTIVSTGALIPLEFIELVRHFTATRIIVLILNIAIVIYLIVRLCQKHAAQRRTECPPAQENR